MRKLETGNYLVEVEPDSGMDYRQALIVAMKKEKAASSCPLTWLQR